MDLKILIFNVFVIVLSSNQCLSLSNWDVTEPDMIRNVYLKVEKTLWENVINDPTKTQKDRLTSIFNDHSQFVNTYLDGHINFDALKAMMETFSLNELESELISVHRIFKSFQQHLNRETKSLKRGIFNEEVSLDLTEHVLDDSSWPLRDSIDSLHQLIVQKRLLYEGLTAKAPFHGHFTCLQRSDQQVNYQLYDAIVTTQLQAYMMMQCSYMLRTVYQKDDYSSQSAAFRSDYVRATIESLQVAQDIFEKASRSIYRCDPENYVENSTFLQITRLLQGHIENEMDLNRERTCVDTCQNYQFTEEFGCTDRSICRSQSKCQGKILSCTTLSDNMWICPGNKESLRRYDYIVYDNGDVLGEEKFCPTKGFHAEQYWFYNVLWHCDHCFCICDEQGKKSDRYFSLRPAVSDTKNNMVVTGLRFVKQNRIIHLQVKQGLLLKFGKVDESTAHWVPVSQFTILDRGVRDGIDYHTLDFNRRQVDLDALVAPASHVVTGVKLRRLGNHLNLEMRVSEINFSTGKIVEPEKNFWLSNDNTENSVGKEKRLEISLKQPHIPTRSKSPSTRVSLPNTFLKFTHSDMWKDAAQTTVPFLDSQYVSAAEESPLQGVGLYFKGNSGFGGFIAPQIETLDFSSYIKANLQNFKTENDL